MKEQWNNFIENRFHWHTRKEKMMWALINRMPRRLVYWCALRVGVSATTGEYAQTVVPELRFMDAIQRWEK